MKLKFTIVTGLFILCNLLLYSHDALTVREQLESLNKYWKRVDYDHPVLQTRLQLTSDFDLITTHLSLVEKHLRLNQNSLSENQSKKRKMCLDILKEYRERGVFPVNSHHSKRTPYFIDDSGTACAVGQLIISTGHGTLAKKISSENNYAYIEDLKYPELIAWADTYGFTLDELKWIQPTYGCVNSMCANDTKRDVSCHGGSDGCFGAFTPSNLSSPFMYNWFRFHDASNTWIGINNPCDLPAGTYKCKITDSGGNFEESIYYVEQPDSISISANIVNDNGSCNGSIVVNFSGDNPPYRASWLHDSDTTTSISGLCYGTYSVSVIDNNNCNKVFNVSIDLSTDVSNPVSNKSIRISPNPTSERINVSSQIPDNKVSSVIIYDYTGKQVVSTVISDTNILDVSNLQDGTYILKIGASHQRFIKSSR